MPRVREVPDVHEVTIVANTCHRALGILVLGVGQLQFGNRHPAPNWATCRLFFVHKLTTQKGHA